MKENSLQKLKKHKKKIFGSTRLPGVINTAPFSLILLTYDSLNRSNIISLLSKWRKKHEFWFPAQFPIDDERTKTWLAKRVLEVPDRTLFIVEVENQFIGHVGLFRYDEATQTIDIDNIVRGESGFKGIISESIRLLMEWGKMELGIKTYTLETSSDNKKALALYKRLGFTETKRVPMTYRKTAEGGEWVKAGDDKNIGRYEVFMKKIV